MSSEKNNPKLDPVLLVTVGIGLLTFAVVMLALQDQSGVSLGAETSSASQIFVAFLTGLTTGGLSCQAVQNLKV